jgi:hypothetical protein
LSTWMFTFPLCVVRVRLYVLVLGTLITRFAVYTTPLLTWMAAPAFIVVTLSLAV